MDRYSIALKKPIPIPIPELAEPVVTTETVQKAIRENSGTFDFGSGPVSAHRHVNPDGSQGGWIAETARVALTAFMETLK